MQRNNRVNVRLNDAELRQLNSLSAKLGDSQSSTFRTLLFLSEEKEKLAENQKKLVAEIGNLKAEIITMKNEFSELKSWLISRIE